MRVLELDGHGCMVSMTSIHQPVRRNKEEGSGRSFQLKEVRERETEDSHGITPEAMDHDVE